MAKWHALARVGGARPTLRGGARDARGALAGHLLTDGGTGSGGYRDRTVIKLARWSSRPMRGSRGPRARVARHDRRERTMNTWLQNDSADILARLTRRARYAVSTYYAATGDTRAHGGSGEARVSAEDVAMSAYERLMRDCARFDVVAHDIDDRMPSYWYREETDTAPERTMSRAYLLTRAVSRGMAACGLRLDAREREALLIDGAYTMGGDAGDHSADRLPMAPARESVVGDAVARLIRSRAIGDAKRGSESARAYLVALGMAWQGESVAACRDAALSEARGSRMHRRTDRERALRAYAADLYAVRDAFDDMTAH